MALVPAGPYLFVHGPQRLGPAVHHRLEAVFAPEALKVADLVPLADSGPFLGAILIKHHIVGGSFAEPALAPHRRDDPVEFHWLPVRGMHEYQPLGQRGA